MKSIIHVNQQIIARNRKYGTDEPAIIVRTYKGSYTARHVLIDGPSEIISSPHKPLRCGARVWIETNAQVRSS